MSSALRDVYIILYACTYIQRVDYTRVLKTTESGIGRKDGNLLSFFFPAHISRSVTEERWWWEGNLSAYLSHTH